MTAFSGAQKNQLAWLGVPLDSIDVDPRTNANANEDDAFTQTFTSLQHQIYLGNSFSMRSAAYFNFLDGNYDFDLNNFVGLAPTDSMFNYDFRSFFGGGFTSFRYTRSRIRASIGVHANRYRRGHFGSIRNVGDLYLNHGFRQMASAFAKFVATVKRFRFYADVQYRYSDFAYEGSVEMEKMKWNFLNPRAGLSYQLTENGSDLYVSVGRTGREPTRNDIFGGWDDLPADSLGNPLLVITTPEYVTDIELGTHLKGQRWLLNANLFLMLFQDEITLQGAFGPNGLPLTQTLDGSFRSGLEIDATVKIGTTGLELVNQSAFNFSKVLLDVSLTPALTPNVVVNQFVNFRKNRWFFSVNARYQGESFIDLNNTATLPSYFILDGSVHYQLPHWKFALHGRNLTNARYFNGGAIDIFGNPTYFIQAPINGFASVAWTF